MEQIIEKARRDHRQLLFWPSVIYPDISPSVSWSIWVQMQLTQSACCGLGAHQAFRWSPKWHLQHSCSSEMKVYNLWGIRSSFSSLSVISSRWGHNVQLSNYPYVTKRAVLKGWSINSKIPAQYINMLRHQNRWPNKQKQQWTIILAVPEKRTIKQSLKSHSQLTSIVISLATSMNYIFNQA